jgi:DNA-binding IclR family transcriptional regulator
MLAVLDLFTEAAPVWTAEALTAKLGYSLPTGYRYVRELTSVGLLRRGAGGTYLLGSRVIELDYQIRVADPLLAAGSTIMRELAEATGCDVVLGTLYGERMVTVHQAHGSEGVSASYGRGRRLPLFRGMLSKTLLAVLPRAQLRKLYEHHAEEAAGVPFARDWEALLANLKQIRGNGYAVTEGELDPGLVGIGVPVVSRPDSIIAALGLVMTRQRHATLDVDKTVQLLGQAAARILTVLTQAQGEQAAGLG